MFRTRSVARNLTASALRVPGSARSSDNAPLIQTLGVRTTERTTGDIGPPNQHFRFSADGHTYTDVDGRAIPHITELLERAGWLDTLWMTEESRERGTAIHRLTAAYDLGGLDMAAVPDPYRAYLLAYQTARVSLRASWAEIEVPHVHPVLRFGGRPDRVGTAFGLRTVLEIKTGDPHKSHPIQLALQSLLVATPSGLPAEHYQRLCLYLKSSGKFSLKIPDQRSDYDKARKIVRDCC